MNQLLDRVRRQLVLQRQPLVRRAASLTLVVGGAAVLVGAGQDDRHHVAARATAWQSAVADTDKPIETNPRARALSRDASRTERRDAEDVRLSRAAQRARLTRESALRRDARRASDHARALERRAAWTMPLTSFRTTSTFGLSSSLWSSTHTGLDLAAPEGTAIRSIAAGTVQEAGSAGAYGNRTIVRTDDGLDVWYCHQSRIDVDAGDRVTAGQRIGAVGSTGNVTGPHLHLEIRPGGGDPVDPAATLARRGLQF
ncbi:M23 family metallopeptidase [Nocardioides aurantiacus]|uniref:Murein DD-endopeptidase MepM/ murein hydrolase activator NlpD n=1 Tax=Nocardioides aurantiacus TaxID=86796 RepID=A0A3N2CWH1_9ACTN|nr:M23 family metallopeptidase [Nocardioides aurantiacus]ROR91833.1 murein DD-endopeptidase MepM/ murein hydrolase activator NlpD [Nocardioides aurantiacus]